MHVKHFAYKFVWLCSYNHVYATGLKATNVQVRQEHGTATDTIIQLENNSGLQNGSLTVNLQQNCLGYGK